MNREIECTYLFLTLVTTIMFTVKKYILFTALLSYGLLSFPQEIHRNLLAYYDYPDSTLYTSMQKIMDGLFPVSYVSIKTFGFHSVERPIPLREGEGKDGYLLEANIDQVFPLIWNKNQEGHFTQTFRWSFRYAPCLRVSQDDSYLIIPTNQKVGMQFDKILWDNQTRFFFKAPKGHRYDYINNYDWMRGNEPLQMLHMQGNLMHYSNGQSSGVYASLSDSLLQRNDYTKGDFSTNFFNVMLIYSRYKESLTSVGLGCQFELGKHLGAFGFNKEQEKRYGKTRLLGLIQYRTRPLKNILAPYITYYDPETGKSYRVKRQREIRFRLETEYILGDLSDFKRNHSYRMNGKFTAEFNLLRAKSFNFFIDAYYGRDYLNIRYDDIIWCFHFGASFSLLRYRPPRFNPLKDIKEIPTSKIKKYYEQFKK